MGWGVDEMWAMVVGCNLVEARKRAREEEGEERGVGWVLEEREGLVVRR